MKKLFAAAILLTAGFSMSAHAGLISGPITFDGGKSVDLQGLEWMPVTYTAGLSRVDVEGGFSDVTKMWGTGGWRYATRAETEKLLGSLWGGRYDGWSFDNFAGASTFLEAFGATGSYGTMHRYSYFYFGKPEDCVTLPGYTCFASLEAVAEYDYDLFSSDRTANWQQSISFKAGQSGAGRFLESAGVDMGNDPYNSVYTDRSRDRSVGSLLVRSADTPVSTVSSPASLSLFALGLCGLLLRRRKIAA